jgi:hypothetical protein
MDLNINLQVKGNINRSQRTKKFKLRHQQRISTGSINSKVKFASALVVTKRGVLSVKL